MDANWEIWNNSGNSGGLAVLLAILMGYDRIVLAGMPMDGSGRFFDDPNQVWVDYSRGGVERCWLEYKEFVFRNRVRSMSGNTALWLGKPTERWLNGK